MGFINHRSHHWGAPSCTSSIDDPQINGFSCGPGCHFYLPWLGMVELSHKNHDFGDVFFFFKDVGYYLFTWIVGLSITYYLLMVLPIYLFTLNITPSLFSYGKITTYEPWDDAPSTKIEAEPQALRVSKGYKYVAIIFPMKYPTWSKTMDYIPMISISSIPVNCTIYIHSSKAL